MGGPDPQTGAKPPAMLVLGLDTALGACSAALWRDGTIRAAASEPMARGHAERLAPLVAELMAQAGAPPASLDRIGVTVGPGTFTGQRVALALARGMAAALAIPCLGLTTTLALAATARARHPGAPAYAAALDARKDEIALHVFDAALGECLPLAMRPAAEAARRVPPGAVVAGTALGAAIAWPDPAVIAGLAAAADPAAHPPEPVYWRPPDAKLPGGRAIDPA